MPHYKNGVPAAIGDLILCAPPHPGASMTLGILVAITPGADSCNGQLLPVARRWSGAHWIPVLPLYPDYITLKDCLAVNSGAQPESAAA